MGRKKKEVVAKEEAKKEMEDFSKLKQELEEYVIVTVRHEMQEEIEKGNKKIIREKNRKIVFRNIVIILLLAIIGFLLYLLNSVGYFNRFFVNEKVNNEEKTTIDEKIIDEEGSKEKEEVVKPTFDELKEKYQKYLDNYYISEKSAYLKEYYSGHLTDELKNYLALNQVNFNLLKQEEDYQVLDVSTLKEAYGRIFSSEYKSLSFDYNGNRVRFINSIEAYLTDDKLDKTTNIEREIIDIEEKDNEVIIKTVEGVLSNTKLYSIDGELINEYNNDGLIKYQDQLNRLSYTFLDGKLIYLSN